MAQIKIYNGVYYAHAQASNAYNFSLSYNSIKDTVRSLSVVSNNPDYLQNYEKKFKTKKIS